MAIRKLADAAKLANPAQPHYRNNPRPSRPDGKGRWFPASYDGECSSCWAPFMKGWEIRADGQGDWEGRECCNHDEE